MGYSGGAPLVTMMQAAHFWDRDDPARRRRLDGSRLRAVLLQCQMRAAPMIVFPVNADQIDKLELVTHPSIAVRALIHCPHRLTCRLVSEPGCAPVGYSRASSSDRSPATLREAAQADAGGSILVGMALYGLAGLEIRGLYHASLYRCGLAPQRLSLVLELEDWTREPWGDQACQKKFAT